MLAHRLRRVSRRLSHGYDLLLDLDAQATKRPIHGNAAIYPQRSGHLFQRGQPLLEGIGRS